MKRLTIKQMEDFYRKMEAAELPGISPWADLPAIRRTVLESIGRMMNEMEYAGVKSLKLREEKGEADEAYVNGSLQAPGPENRKKS